MAQHFKGTFGQGWPKEKQTQALHGKIVRSPGCDVQFGKTKYHQRGAGIAPIQYVSFAKRHLFYALERPDLALVLFSPHYHRSCKGSPLALIKIKLCVFPSSSSRCAQLSSLLRSGNARPLDYIRTMIERNKKRSQDQKQGKDRRPRFFEGQVLFRLGR